LGLLARRCWRADLHVAGSASSAAVWDRQSGLHASEGRPTQEYAAFCGQLRVDWYFCEPADPQAKGVVERLQYFIERSLGTDSPGKADTRTLALPPVRAAPPALGSEPLARRLGSGRWR
jgi:hypothetical protein